MDKILEFCGFEYTPEKVPIKGHTGWTKIWTHADGHKVYIQSQLDMNFFFQYVAPKVERAEIWRNAVDDTWTVIVASGSIWHGNSLDPNKAWQEALLKLISETKKEARE